MEITINDIAYQFNFGMGFLREVNKDVVTKIDGLRGVDKNIGLTFYVSGLIDNDVEALSRVLYIANKGFTPRVSLVTLDEYFEDENTDIAAVFETVMGFLTQSNATKLVVNNLIHNVEVAARLAEKETQN